MTGKRNSMTYADSGVDIDAGEALVEKIKPYAASTKRKGADAKLGGFGALFDLKACGFKDPILVSATDGVGTKLKIAIESGRVGSVGIDLVAMSVNDLIVQGAEPLFFLDYFATGKLDVPHAAAVIKGVAEGCKQAGCALSGGETAEMPGLYAGKDFDLAGFAVGAVERDRVLPRLKAIRANDALIACASSGLHSNGFSLVRKVISTAGLSLEAPAPWDKKQSLAESLLTPTRIYVKPILAALKAHTIHALAHITGGGLTQNLPRVLPNGLDAEIDLSAFRLPGVFDWLMRQGGIAEEEMLRTFNCGIGLIVVAPEGEAGAVIRTLKGLGENAFRIGHVIPGPEAKAARVHYLGQLAP